MTVRSHSKKPFNEATRSASGSSVDNTAYMMQNIPAIVVAHVW